MTGEKEPKAALETADAELTELLRKDGKLQEWVLPAIPSVIGAQWHTGAVP